MVLENPSLQPAALPIDEAAAGNEEAFAEVMRRMAPLIHTQVRLFRTAGTEDEDLAQEALLGLLAAVRSYRPDKGATFTTYATSCIRNRLISVIRRQGPYALREQSLEDEPEVPDSTADPAQRLQDQEGTDALLEKLHQRLTPLEYKVLLLRLSDCSYEEAAHHLGVSKKAIDNAVQRLRRKLSHSL